MDPHAGEVAVGRVYSGRIKHGESVWVVRQKQESTTGGHDGWRG